MSHPVPRSLVGAKSSGRKVPPAVDYRDEVTAGQREQLKELETTLGLNDACWKQDGEAAW